MVLTAVIVTAVIRNGSRNPGSAIQSGVSAQVVSGRGALPEDGHASCAKEYSPTEVSKGAFAFSGTVRAIGPGRTNRGGAQMPLVSATFSVDRWFKGGAGQIVSIDIVDPSPAHAPEGPSPSFGIGTRLLVSGAHRWDEETPDDLLAWACGFTRYYDPTTADRWRAAIGQGQVTKGAHTPR